jgi:signal transduction histidine kinase/ActR/RegA family two-component response regulator
VFPIVTRQLQNKLILAFILVLLIPTGIISFYSLRTAASTLIQKISTEELNASLVQATNIEKRLNDIKEDLIFLSQAPPTRRFASVMNGLEDPTSALRDAEIALFKTFLNRSTNQYKDIRIIDIAGQELLRINGDGQLAMDASILENQAGQPYFNQAIGLPSNQVYISDFDLNRTNGRIDKPYVPILYYSTPLQVDGAIVGVLVAKIVLSPIFKEISAYSNSPIYLVNQDGSYILNPDSSKLYGKLLKTGITLDNERSRKDVTTMFGSKQGIILDSPDYPDTLETYVQIRLEGQIGLRWLMIHHIPLSSILGEVNSVQRVAIILSIVSLLIAIMVAILFTRSIVRPIRQLAVVADSVRQGSWNVTVPGTTGKDEIGHLAAAFEAMLRELKAVYSNLEDRVAARTTELETTNIKLTEAQRKAEEASRAKSLFLSNMSHELRTPLNVIIGYSHSMLFMPQMFNNIPFPDIYRPYLKLIEDNGYYLIGLINDILDLSKIEAGKFELSCATVDLPETFRGVLATATGLLKDKPIQLRPDYPEDLPLVWADPIRVRQIILNLFSNALKFTNTGSVTLKAEVNHDATWVSISVIDTGIGIPKEAQATIFDRFGQINDSERREVEGTGLGLGISKQLSQMHGGDLVVTSKVGKGSKFTFTLPIATPEQIELQQPTPQSTKSFALFNRSESAEEDVFSILLVEDEVSTRELLRRSLETAGYLVVDTHDGAQVVELVRGLLPDLIILDINIPHVNGWDIMQQLKTDPTVKSIPIIVYTASTDYQRATQQGATAFISKPATPEEVLKVVRHLSSMVGYVERGYLADWNSDSMSTNGSR